METRTISPKQFVEGKPKRTCPRCNKSYKNYPAISRRDNKTEICPKCGTSEALFDFMINRMETNLQQKVLDEEAWLNKPSSYSNDCKEVNDVNDVNENGI